MKLLSTALFCALGIAAPCAATAAEQDEFHPTISAKGFVDLCEPSMPSLARIEKQKGDTQGVSQDDLEALTVCTAIVESVDTVVSAANHYNFGKANTEVEDHGLNKPDIIREVIRYAQANPDYLKDPDLPAAALVLFAMADYQGKDAMKGLFKCGDLYSTKNKPGCTPASTN
jgi:hypothetical protein